MEQVWYTIEGHGGLWWCEADEVFMDNECEASVYDEYNDAALVAEGLKNCSVIKHTRQVGRVGSHMTSIAGEF